jgi:hypothetical protein
MSIIPSHAVRVYSRHVFDGARKALVGPTALPDRINFFVAGTDGTQPLHVAYTARARDNRSYWESVIGGDGLACEMPCAVS